MKLFTKSSDFVIFVILLLLFAESCCLSRRRARNPFAKKRPNIILIMTDDQDVALGSMEFMPKTLRLLRNKGIEFSNGFVTTPICCPSRSSILTGLYVHNHHVLTNNENCTGKEWRSVHENRTFGAYLQRDGYRTGYFGKYLNEYDGSYIPAGWHEWVGLVKNSRFYNYTVNFNGRHIKHGFDYEKDYLTDLIANDTITFMRRQRRLYSAGPFLAVLSFPAPHGPEDPAPKYAHLFDHVKTHRTAAWNYAPNPDKQWLLQRTSKMEPVHVVFTDMLHRRRLQTLQSVDDNIQRVINELRDMRQLANTYIIYTSDHGYHLGQFGLIKGKNMPYDFDLKVPYFIRGPRGTPRGIRIWESVANIDLAPTILDIANVPIPAFMDGQSLIPLIQNYSSPVDNFEWRHALLVERGKMPKLKRIRDRVLKQRDRFSKEARIRTECSKDIYKPPCSNQQKWECRKNKMGQYRIFKCHSLIEMDRDCVCEKNVRKNGIGRHREKSKRRRSRRDLIISHYDSYHMKRVDTFMQLSSEYANFTVDFEPKWQEEFLTDIYEQDLMTDGEWYQGRADRTKCSVLFNYTASFIDNNNKTLQNAKSSTGKYKRAVRAIEDVIQRKRKKCHCSNPVFHPLVETGNDLDFSSADLMAYHLEKRQRRRERRGRGNGKRRPKFGTRKWYRQDTKDKCNVAQMNCFSHNAQHWRTPPLWPAAFGDFCFCQNANNNTYWCLRTLNTTSNFLYCEFVTEFVSFYDLNVDPNQLTNLAYTLPVPVLEQLSQQLSKLKHCKGGEQCKIYSRPADRG